MKVPDWWEFLLLALSTFRIWRLTAEDEILEIPRRKIVRLSREWQDGDMLPEGYRLGLAKFISCPWCWGFWLSASIWLLWLWQPLWTAGLSVPLALSAVVGFIEHFSGESEQ